MQRMWKQSPRQSVGLYDIRLHTKKLRYQKLHGPIGGGGGRPIRLPLDPPLGAMVMFSLLFVCLSVSLSVSLSAVNRITQKVVGEFG